MGLKTTNYEVKRTGQFLPTAYAIVKNLTVRGLSGYAEIIIQTSRETADKCVKGQLDAIDTKRIDFKVDRDANDRVTAYEAAKKKKTCMEHNGEFDENGMPIEVEVVVDEQFFGWYDDIV